MPACLDFHKTQRTVLTASGWQVRQPLFTRSVGRWRKYERHLGPLREVLAQGAVGSEPAGECGGYTRLPIAGVKVAAELSAFL